MIKLYKNANSFKMSVRSRMSKYTPLILTARRMSSSQVPVANVKPGQEKEVHEVRIPVPWGHIAGKWWGNTERQPILGLHELRGDASTFNNMAESLNADSFFAVDLIGHGLSSRFPQRGEPTILDFLLMLKVIQNHYKWEKISMIGHLSGGVIGFIYSGIYPDSVDKLINIGDSPLSFVKFPGIKLCGLQSLINQKSSDAGKNYKIYYEGIFQADSDDTLKSIELPFCNCGHGLEPCKANMDFISECASRIKGTVLSLNSKCELSTKSISSDNFSDFLKQATNAEIIEVEGTGQKLLDNCNAYVPAINRFLEICKWWGPHDVKPLVTLHGWHDNANSWDKLAPLISPQVGLLCIDFPGHGLSSHFPPGQPYHHLDYVSVIRRVADHFKWDSVSLMGHSIGGIIAFMYSSIYPQEVDRFITVDAFGPISRTPNSTLDNWRTNIDNLVKVFTWNEIDNPKYSYETIVENMRKALKYSLTYDSAEIILKRGAIGIENGSYAFTRDPRIKYLVIPGWSHEQILQLAKNIVCDVLHIRATSSFKFEKEERYSDKLEACSKVARSFKHQTVEGTHHVHLNEPEKLAPIINKFLLGKNKVNII